MAIRHWVGAVLLVTSAATAEAGPFKAIRDWSVSCDIAMRCDMSHSNWENDGLKSFALRRALDPNAPLQIVVSAPPDFDNKGDAAGRVAISVDGRRVLEVPVSAMTEGQGGADLVYQGEDVMALAQAMKAGTSAVVSYDGDRGRFELPLPLSGVTGSLLFMDEAQDRLERVDALQAKGERPVPDGLDLAEIVFDTIPDAIRKSYAEEDGICYIELDRRDYFSGIEIRGEYGRRIVILPCGSPGAYNQPYAAYAGYDGRLEALQFPDMTEEGPSTLSMPFNVDYDWTERRISAFFKGRGLGDCGASHVWAVNLDREEGLLVLKEQRVKGDCDGKDDEWPLVWPR